MQYEKLLTARPPLISEKPHPYALMTERHIQVMWYEQKYFKGLYTPSGEIITVISPGIWNSEAGPDFLKAHIKIGDREFRGDVEIHFYDGDWLHHKHHEDLNYEHVVLHVALWKSKNQQCLKTIKGQTFIQSYLEESLTIPQTRIVQLIDLDLYPYKQFTGSGKCAKKLFNKLTTNEILLFFNSAAKWRLLQKHRYLTTRFPESHMQIPAGIALALGYRDNAEEFLHLFNFLYPFRHLPENQLLAIALGVAGYFEERYKKKWNDSDYYLFLETLWIEFAPHLLHQTNFKNSKIRPLNHPIRRLTYLVKLLGDLRLETLTEQALKEWTMSWQNCRTPSSWKQLQLRLQAIIPDYLDAYWNGHYTFETSLQKTFLTLMGADLKNQILLNTFLPILFQDITSRHSELELGAFNNFYSSFRNAKNSKSAYLAHRFFGESKNTQLLKKSATAQGAYQLHHDFCLRYESSCEGCPFVDRYLGKESSLL